MMSSPPPWARQRAARLRFILILLVFSVPLLAAVTLTLAGYKPQAKAYGRPVIPQRNLQQEQLEVRLADGRLYPWRDSKPRLSLVALAGPGCAAHCAEILTKMTAARITLNQHMERLRLLYLGTPPADEVAEIRNYWQLGQDVAHRLAAFAPSQADAVSALLVESNGTVLAFYPPGFDPNGLRKDLQRVIR